MHSPRETATSMSFFFFLVGGGGVDFPASAPGQGLVLVAWLAPAAPESHERGISFFFLPLLTFSGCRPSFLPTRALSAMCRRGSRVPGACFLRARRAGASCPPPLPLPCPAPAPSPPPSPTSKPISRAGLTRRLPPSPPTLLLPSPRSYPFPFFPGAFGFSPSVPAPWGYCLFPYPPAFG